MGSKYKLGNKIFERLYPKRMKEGELASGLVTKRMTTVKDADFVGMKVPALCRAEIRER